MYYVDCEMSFTNDHGPFSFQKECKKTKLYHLFTQVLKKKV